VLVDITNTLSEVEQDVKTPFGRKELIDESSMNIPFECKSGEKSATAEVDCKIIRSPPRFGLFDLDINSTLNR
jgi:hypothetical protein